MYDSQGNFINPGLVTQDIGTALANQALGTYNLGPTLSQDTINSLSNPLASLNLAGLAPYLPWIGIGLIIIFVDKKSNG